MRNIPPRALASIEESKHPRKQPGGYMSKKRGISYFERNDDEDDEGDEDDEEEEAVVNQ